MALAPRNRAFRGHYIGIHPILGCYYPPINGKSNGQDDKHKMDTGIKGVKVFGARYTSYKTLVLSLTVVVCHQGYRISACYKLGFPLHMVTRWWENILDPVCVCVRVCGFTDSNLRALGFTTEGGWGLP